MNRLFLLPALLLCAAAPPKLLAARGAWAAFDRGTHCEAVARSELLAPRTVAQPYVTLSFSRSPRRAGELMVVFKRPLRPGSAVTLTVGGQPFLLAASGNRAWSRGPAQELAILASIRAAGDMRAEGRDSAGRRMADRYLLAGAPLAIDAAAAACSLKR